MNTIPKKQYVRLGRYWPGEGQLVDVRVRYGDDWRWHTAMQRNGESIADVVRRVRRDFRQARLPRLTQVSVKL